VSRRSGIGSPGGARPGVPRRGVKSFAVCSKLLLTPADGFNRKVALLSTYSFVCKSRGLCLAIASWVFIAPSAQASVFLNDTFDVGSPATRGNDAADPLDAAWWSAQNTPLLTIVNDAGGINQGNALQVDTSSGGNGRQVFANQFGTVSLGYNMGDQVKLSFDFRFKTIVPGNSTTLEFGLYNDNGTTIMADNQKPASDNDGGYFAAIGFGTFSAASVMREAGGGGALLSGNDITDQTTSSSPIAINDLLAHTASLTVTRSASDAVQLELTIDGVSRASGEDSPLILTTFNELAFLNESKELDYVLDNVKVESVLVPEPGTLALLGLGAAAFSWNRLRARARKK
jgi:hypothetical protein